MVFFFLPQHPLIALQMAFKKWMHLAILTLKEVSQKEKDKYHMISPIYKI